MTTQQNTQTEKVFNHHFQAVMAKNVDEMLLDYAEDSVIFTQQGPVTGLEGLRAMFAGPVMDLLTDEVLKNIKIVRQDIVGDVVYVVWEVPGIIPFATDTFVIRNGKIAAQTFTMQSA